MPNQSDDTTGSYLKERQSVQLTPAQRLKISQTPQPQIADPGADKFSLSPGKIVKDIARGVIETPTQVFGGVTDAIKEAGQVADSLLNAMNIPSVLQIVNEKGEFDPDLMTASEFESKGLKTPVGAIDVKKPVTTTGGLVRGISQFMTGFLPATRALKGVKAVSTVGKAAKVAAIGAAADVIVFDPHEDRLSNLIEQHPELQNPVTGYLAADPEDSEAEGRFKNAVEGLGLGALTDGFFLAVKGIRASRRAKILKKADQAEKATIDKLASVADEAEVKPDDMAAKVEPDEDFKQFDEPDPDEPVFKTGSKKAGEERALNINIDRLDTTEDVESLIEDVGKKFSKDINEARREVITHEETKKLADDLGMTVESLLSRRKGEAFNAEQAVAARRILVASGENLMKLAKAARAGSDVDVMKFRKAMSRHHAIQTQVSGLTAEAGRALSSFNIKAKSAKEQERLISETLIAAGGPDNSRILAKQLSQLEGPHQVNAFVKQASGATTKAMLYEAWINGLLSSPATHTVNVLSNSLVAGWSVGERKIASMIGAGLDFQNIPEGEATAQLFGMVQGAKDGMRLAWKALKTGEPSDVIGKIEVIDHKAITAENLNLSGVPGRFADFVGGVVRTPGRFLTAGDEFFKSTGYRMELHAQAFRQASSEGLQGEDLAKRITDIVENPPENINLAAVDASRYQTFTKPLEETGQALQNMISKTPGARLIVPFIRTPVNIMKYVGERTPLAPVSKNIRAEINAGGARRDMALAKIATGSMIMAAAADYTLSGQVTGGGPKHPVMKARLRETGWQPYSIKIGETYYSYNRLDPIGAFIGLGADVSEVMGQTTEADGMDLATAAVIAVAQNVTSKTYLSGVAEFFDVMSSVSADPEKNNRQAQRWIERFAGTVVPAVVAGVERAVSPELEATQGILEKIKSRIPGYSDDLPPRRNVFGEPIVLSGGLGPDIMSPIYTNSDKKDKVADEIVNQRTLIRMPGKIIDGVELTTDQYDKYIQLYSGKNNPYTRNTLKRELAELFRKPIYQNATNGQEGGKSTLIKSVFEAHRKAAKQALLEQDPRLFLDTQNLKREKMIKMGAM